MRASCDKQQLKDTPAALGAIIIIAIAGRYSHNPRVFVHAQRGRRRVSGTNRSSIAGGFDVWQPGTFAGAVRIAHRAINQSPDPAQHRFDIRTGAFQVEDYS
jgi:hypothetical protein